MHEDPGQVQLHLEPDVDVGAVDRRRPPQRETTVRDLVQPRTLRVRQLLELHRLFETRGLLPEQALPRGKISALEQGVLKDALHTAQSLDHIGTVVVQVPQFAVVLLMGPPEWVLLQELVLFEVLPDSPAFIVGQREPILLEESVDPGNTVIPGLLQIIQRQPPILALGLLAFHGILRPHPLTVNKLRLPSLYVPVQIGY